MNRSSFAVTLASLLKYQGSLKNKNPLIFVSGNQYVESRWQCNLQTDRYFDSVEIFRARKCKNLRSQHVSLPTCHSERKEDNSEVAYSGNCMIYLNRLRCHVAALLNLNSRYCVQVFGFSWSMKSENEMARCLNHRNYYFVCHCCR